MVWFTRLTHNKLVKMSEFYWELVYWKENPKDPTKLEVPPSGVEVIKRRWDNGQPIHTAKSGSIPANHISSFTPTGKIFSTQPLLDTASQAFNEPQINDDGSIRCKWVKKHVTSDKWNKHYSHTGYRKLGEESGMVIVAFKQPIHQVNPELVEFCSDEEVHTLINKV